MSRRFFTNFRPSNCYNAASEQLFAARACLLRSGALMFRFSLVLMGLFLPLGAANAGWFGPSTYNECILAEMQGRPAYMMGTVEKDCQAKFCAYREETTEEMEQSLEYSRHSSECERRSLFGPAYETTPAYCIIPDLSVCK